MQEIREIGEQKIYRIGFGYFLFQLIVCVPIMALALVTTGLISVAPIESFVIVLGPFIVVMAVWATSILVSSFWLRLTLNSEGLEYRTLGYRLIADWSDIKTIETDHILGEYVMLKKFTIKGSPLFGFLFGPMSYAMSIPLSNRAGKIWGKDVVPDIVAFAQASKSK